MIMTEVHVVPDERTTWRVYDTDADAPISEHTNATEAELAARARAEDRDAERGVVHDRYHRTHDAAPSPAGEARASNSNARAGWTASANALASWPARQAKAGSQPVSGLVDRRWPRAADRARQPGSARLSANGEVLQLAIAGDLDSDGGGEESRSAMWEV